MKTSLIAKFISANKCTVLTAMLAALFLIETMFCLDPEYHKYIIGMYMLFMIIGPYFLTSRRKLIVFPVAIGMLAVISRVLLNFNISESEQIIVLLGIFLIFSEIFLTACIVQYTLTRKGFAREQLFGIIFAYLMLAITFGDVYFIIYSLNSSSFIFTPDLKDTSGIFELNDFIYFSFVTLSGLGYGDIVPYTALAKRIAAIEVVGGILYVAVFIGKIVSNFTAAHNSQSKARQIPLRKKLIKYRAKMD